MEKTKMPRLKTRFVVEFEYDAMPNGYDGVTDPDEMAAVDQAGAEEDPEQSLQYWLGVASDNNVNMEKNFTVESEVIHD